MRNWIAFTLVLLLTSGFVFAQTPAVDLVLTVSDGAGGTQELRLGLDPTATDGIDAGLGEAELPPFPPGGVFEARFIGDDLVPAAPLGQGSYKDYRTGDRNFRSTKMHELRYQVGTGTSIVISWNLSNGATGMLQDLLGGIVVNQVMRGTGNFTVTNPGVINKLKMTIDYSTTEVKESPSQLPQAFSLAQNYPNPFNPSTAIKFILPEAAMVTLQIFNETGQLVRALVDGEMNVGRHELRWDGRNQSGHAVAAGVYFYQLVVKRQSGETAFMQTRRMAFVK